MSRRALLLGSMIRVMMFIWVVDDQNAQWISKKRGVQRESLISAISLAAPPNQKTNVHFYSYNLTHQFYW
jgi:hypothetical protein